jgi:hypothetical protein
MVEDPIFVPCPQIRRSERRSCHGRMAPLVARLACGYGPHNRNAAISGGFKPDAVNLYSSEAVLHPGLVAGLIIGWRGGLGVALLAGAGFAIGTPSQPRLERADAQPSSLVLLYVADCLFWRIVRR